MYRKVSTSLLVLAVLLFPSLASAHVVVKPATVNVGQFTTFTVSVPNEKTVPVTNVRVSIPSGVAFVTPTVKDGWTITTQKSGKDESSTTTSIQWDGGSIPAGFRDDFTFSAQSPAKASTLQWKAYQTYEDGTVVSWDETPTSKEAESEHSGPYSETKVVNDLSKTAQTTPQQGSSSTANLSLALAGLALVISVGSILFKKR